MSSPPLSEPSARRPYGGISATERHRLRRAKLIEAGLELFGTAGYSATSIEAVCAAAGVSTRNYYDHFRNREELLVAVYDQITLEAQQAILQASAQPGLTMEQQARAGLTAFARFMVGDERRARVNFIEVIGASHAVEARRREVIRSFAAILEAFARQLIDQGVIPHKEVRTGALALIGAVQEVLRDWVTGDERPPLEPIIDDLVRLFIAAANA